MDVSRSIKYCLLDRDIFKKDLAEGIGVTPVTMSRLCREPECSGKLLVKLADFFNMSVSEFVARGE